MISEDDLLAASIHFDPALYNKRAKKFQVYLIPRGGSLIKGGFKGITLHNKKDELFGKRIPIVDVPLTLRYDNRPEYENEKFPIKELTKEALRHRVLEAYEAELRRNGKHHAVAVNSRSSHPARLNKSALPSFLLYVGFLIFTAGAPQDDETAMRNAGAASVIDKADVLERSALVHC